MAWKELMAKQDFISIYWSSKMIRKKDFGAWFSDGSLE